MYNQPDYSRVPHPSASARPGADREPCRCCQERPALMQYGYCLPCLEVGHVRCRPAEPAVPGGPREVRRAA